MVIFPDWPVDLQKGVDKKVRKTSLVFIFAGNRRMSAMADDDMEPVPD